MLLYLTKALGLTYALLGCGAVASVLPRSSCPQPATTASSFPEPSADPFYSIPHNIGSYANGQVIRTRGIYNTTELGMANARQVFYRTTNRQGHATGTVTTVFVPPVPADPPKLFSYQNPEDALALRCAPSWAIVNASSEQETYLTPLISLFAEFSAANGYYFITSDDEDRGADWLVGLTEGRATVDGIRAATESLCLDSPAVGLLGYSGGAHETVWALNQVTNGYACDIDVVGAAFGGTPVDLGSNFELLNGSPEAVLAGGAIVGLSKGYPKLRKTLNRLATKKGRKYLDELRGKDACLVEYESDFTNVNFSSPKVFKGGNIQNNPIVKGIVDKESLLVNVTPLAVPVPKMPRLEWHGTADTTVPYPAEVEYVHQQCKRGADIRFTSLPGQNHGEAAITGIPGALQFLQEAFSGTITPAKPCGENVTLPAIDSAEALKLLGPKIVAVLEAELQAGA